MPNNRWFHTARKESPQYCAIEISEINFQDFTADGTVVPILIQHLFGLYQGCDKCANCTSKFLCSADKHLKLMRFVWYRAVYNYLLPLGFFPFKAQTFPPDLSSIKRSKY